MLGRPLPSSLSCINHWLTCNSTFADEFDNESDDEVYEASDDDYWFW